MATASEGRIVAFVRTVGDTFQITGFDGAGGRTIITAIGYDDASSKGYTAVVGLDFMVGSEALEFFFKILEVDPYSDTVVDYWCGKDVAEFITKEDREPILGAILSMTEGLLKRNEPKKVFYCTYDADPPEKALIKHQLMIEVFKSCGYEVTTADPYHGKRVWWMERK